MEFQYIKDSFKKINYKLYFALLLMGFLPTIYVTVRVFLLADLPSDYGFNIASQLAWVNLIYEVIAEAIILPLFFFTGAVLHNKKELENRSKTGLLVVLITNVAMAVLLISFAEPLVMLMAQDTGLVETTASFVRIESIAKIFEISVKVLLVVMITLGKKLGLYIIIGTQVVLTIIMDIILFSPLSFSLGVGVIGIPLSNIVTNLVGLIVIIILLKKSGINILSKRKMDFSWMGKFTKVGAISGLESLVRNLAFMLMILRMVNVVGEQGTYWVANSFIWGWLLLPVLQLGELIKRDSGESKALIPSKTAGYFAVTTMIVISWIISIPFWKPFFVNIMGLENADEIFSLVILLLGFYVVFAYNNVIDSIFYGLGRTDLMLYQSLIVNILYYGAAFVLYILGIYTPTLTSIALMFGVGIVIDSVITGLIFWGYCQRNKVVLSPKL